MNNQAGIYKLTNLINSKIYIGKTHNFHIRMIQHKNTKSQCYIGRAIRKYGWNNFRLDILETFNSIDNNLLLEKEAIWIEKFNSTDKKIGYNLLKFGNDTTGFKHKMSTRRKMSNRHWSRCADFKKILEIKGKLRNASLHQNHYACKRPIKQINKHTGQVIKIWAGIVDAASVLINRKDSSEIRKVCSGCIDSKGYRVKTAHGFRWEYV